MMVNTTVYQYSGPLVFSSPVQLSGKAAWKTDCNSSATNLTCSNGDAKSLTASGQVPFVINLNTP